MVNQTKSKAGRGGAGRGQGRKPGSLTKKTREVAERAAEEGVTPLEVMLENMRFAHGQAGTVLAGLLESGAEIPEGFDQFKELLRFRAMAQDAAKDAAPYMHPRLSSVDLNAKISPHESSLDELA